MILVSSEEGCLERRFFVNCAWEDIVLRVRGRVLRRMRFARRSIRGGRGTWCVIWWVGGGWRVDFWRGIISVIHLGFCGVVMLNQHDCHNQRASCPHETSYKACLFVPNAPQKRVILWKYYRIECISSIYSPVMPDPRGRQIGSTLHWSSTESDDCHTFLSIRDMTGVSTVQSRLRSKLRLVSEIWIRAWSWKFLWKPVRWLNTEIKLSVV